MRKVQRVGVWNASRSIFWTGIRATSLDQFSNFVVEQLVDIAIFLYGRTSRSWLEEDRARKRLAHKFRKNVAIFGGSILLGAFGFAVGTMIDPKRGSMIGGLIGGYILYFV